MKTFLAALLGAVAAILLLVASFWLLDGSAAWRYPTGRLLNLLPRDDRASEQAHDEAARLRQQRQRADRQRDELQDQRRQRLALLAATLRTRPLGPLTAAEKHLFQQDERDRARVSADEAAIELIEPVQIDEWTVLQAGTAVELERADRDNLITIRHEGARYQVSPCQTELRAISGDVCEE